MTQPTLRHLTFLMLLLCGGTASAQVQQNETEPNGTTGTATPVTLTNGVAKVRGNVYPNADEDFYSFAGQAGNRVFIATMTSFSSSSFDSVIELIDINGTTVLETDDNDGSFGTTSSVIAGRALTNSGTHFIRVRNTSATAQIRGYDLYVSVEGGAPTAEVEPNDAPGTATALPASGFVSGTVNPAANGDFYSLALNQGDTLAVIMDCDPERDAVTFNGRIGVGVFAANILVASDANVTSPNGEAIFMTVAATGTYNVYVDDNGAGGSATATYTVSVVVIPAPVATVFTYSSTGAVAIPTGPGQVTSTINVPDTRMIRRIALAIDLTHTLMTDLDVTLQSPNGNEVHLFSDIGSAAFPTMQIGLSDDAGIPINSFTVQQGMVYQPENASKLDLFRGQNTAGTWTLIVRDDLAANGGTLNAWSLIVEEEPALATPASGFQYETIFTTDFESGDAGFTHSGTADEWARGTPSAAPITTANSGTNCFKTDLTGTYNVSSVQNLLSPNINLAGVTGPIYLQWAMKYQMESASFDHAYVEVQVVGQPATVVRVWEWLGATMTQTLGNPGVTVNLSGGWGVYRARIDSFAGQNIEVIFHLDSDTSANFAGMAIDDVSVFGAVPSPEIDVQRSAASIADGTLNHDLGNVSSISGQTFTFTILNTGSGPLKLTGTSPNFVVVTPVSGLGTVTVSVQPTTPVAATTGSTTFNVFVQPSGAAAFSFDILIANNDPDEGPYNVRCIGTGVTNATPVIALTTGSSFAAAGSDFEQTVNPGATLANASLDASDPTPDPIDITITFLTGPQGATPPSGITAPASAAGVTTFPATLTWTGTANASNAPGTYTWLLELDDFISTRTCQVRIIITNTAPAHVVIAPTTGDGSLATPYARNNDIGAVVAFDVATVSDANTGQNVSIFSQTLTASPAGSSATFAFTLNPAAGNPATLICTPSASALIDVGDFDYTIVIEDNTSPTPVQTTLYVTITVVGTAPTITSTAPTTAAVGILYSYQLTATGNPATFTFGASPLPAWLSINGTGLISGTPAITDVGVTPNITATAANGILPIAQQIFTITVAAAVAPAITSTAVTTATEGTLYTYTFTMTGNPTPTLALTSGTLPPWLTLVGNTLSGTPTVGSAGTVGPLTFTASNGVAPNATQTFSIIVSTAGGSGGKKKKDEGGCSTGENNSLLMLAGVMAALGLALRLRRKLA